MTLKTEWDRMYNRFAILWSFDDKEHFLMGYKDLKDKIKVTDPTISFHLAFLVKEGFLFKHKHGVYALTVDGRDLAALGLKAVAYAMHVKVRNTQKLDRRQFNRWIRDMKKMVGEEEISRWKSFIKENEINV